MPPKGVSTYKGRICNGTTTVFTKRIKFVGSKSTCLLATDNTNLRKIKNSPIKIACSKGGP
jgi:hypothetical protein